MPHVRKQEYSKAPPGYRLEYVELIHRHHKRTPYAANTFPKESYSWNCSDEGLFYSGAPLPSGNGSASTYWSVFTSSANPFPPQGFNGTCQFPQITRGGLDDSWQHGKDLFGVYHNLLSFIPSTFDPHRMTYRVTNNVITSQVASMLIAGMYPLTNNRDTPLLIQPASVDSLEPAYSCPNGSALFSSYGSGSTSPAWVAHLNASASLFARLDSVSGISPSTSAWHVSYDYYYDNLSARLCHAKPLPCNITNPSLCITEAEAEEVFRLGQYEYSFIYRDSVQSLPAATATYGVFVAELAQNIRDHIAGKNPIIYRHNVAHDGSVSRLLAILQVDTMVWPGMGAEVVFELFSKEGNYFIRVLWGGKVLKSSNPSLGAMDLIPVNTLLAYIDALVGVGASYVPMKCGVRL